jgi:hypothetical protein
VPRRQFVKQDNDNPAAVASIKDYPVTTPVGTTIRADQAARDAIFERCSAGNGSKGPRYSDWAMTATGTSWDRICRHTALSALAQLRAAAIRGTLTGSITLPAAGPRR